MILIALGGASCVWDDYGLARELAPAAAVGAVNDVAAAYPGDLDLMATLHPEKAQRWLRDRERRGGNMDFPVVAQKAAQGYQPTRVVHERLAGSSGLYLAQIAVEVFGYRRVICCGMPLDEIPHFFGDAAWADAHKYRRSWREGVTTPPLAGKVRSMSGWTSELGGKPDSAWLREIA